MLDLETWGTASGCAIRSVGAVMFDPTSSALGEKYYANIEDASCEAIGLRRSQSTVDWWESPKMRDAASVFLIDRRNIKEVLGEFSAFFRMNGAIRVWSQGANFDEPILSAVFVAAGVVNKDGGPAVPWKFWDSRCTRTAYAMAGLNYNREPRLGTAHNALDDAVHQAKLVQKAYRMLRLNHVEEK
jgi:hypothetical protein